MQDHPNSATADAGARGWFVAIVVSVGLAAALLLTAIPTAWATGSQSPVNQTPPTATPEPAPPEYFLYLPAIFKK